MRTKRLLELDYAARRADKLAEVVKIAAATDNLPVTSL